MAALPKVNDDNHEEIDSQKDNREKLQKSMRSGQLNIVNAVKDLKGELQGMAKSLHAMVKADRAAIKMMREQKGFELEKKREDRDKDDDDGRGHYAERMGFNKKSLFGGIGGKIAGLVTSVFGGIGGIFKNLSGMGTGLLKMLGFKALLGGGFKAGFKTLFTKGFFGKMLLRFGLPALIWTYADDIGAFMKKQFKGTPVDGLFDKSKLGSTSIGMYAAMGGTAAMALFGMNPVAILIGTAAGLAVGAVIHITDWMKFNAKKERDNIKAKMDAALNSKKTADAQARVDAAIAAGKKPDPADVKTLNKGNAAIITTGQEFRLSNIRGGLTETSIISKAAQKGNKKIDKTFYDKAIEIMARVKSPNYFDRDKGLIEQDIRMFREIMNSFKFGVFHRHLGPEKASSFLMDMMGTMKTFREKSPKAVDKKRAHQKNLDVNFDALTNALAKIEGGAAGKDLAKAQRTAKFASMQISEVMASKKGLLMTRDAKGTLTENLQRTEAQNPYNPVEDDRELFVWNNESTSDMTTDDDGRPLTSAELKIRQSRGIRAKLKARKIKQDTDAAEAKWADNITNQRTSRALAAAAYEKNASDYGGSDGDDTGGGKKMRQFWITQDKLAASKQRTSMALAAAAYEKNASDYGGSDGDDTGGGKKMRQFWITQDKLAASKLRDFARNLHKEKMDAAEKQLAAIKALSANPNTWKGRGSMKLRPIQQFDIAGNPNTTVVNNQGDKTVTQISAPKMTVMQQIRSNSTYRHEYYPRDKYWSHF